MFLFCRREPGGDRGSWAYIETRFACPVKRPSGEVGRDTRRRSDPRRNRCFSGSAASNPGASDWIKESKTLVLACFWILFARAKSIPGFGGGAPVNQLRRPGPGRPGSQAPKRLASEETPRRCRRQKTKHAFASQRDKGAKDLCGTTLLAPETGATQACDVTVTPGGAYWGCGGKPAGLVGAAAPRGSSRRAASSALPPKRAALCGGHAGYSSLSTQLSRIAIPYYRQFPDLSTTFPGKKAPVRSNPAHKAVKGATVTRPMEPTTVWISSEATYL